MSNTFGIYLLTRLSAVQGLFIGLTFLFGFVAFISILYRNIELSSDYESDKPKIAKIMRIFRNACIAFSITLIGAIFTPTTQEAMLIIAGGKTLDYVESDTALQKIPYKATEVILHKMDEYLKEDKGGNK